MYFAASGIDSQINSCGDILVCTVSTVVTISIITTCAGYVLRDPQSLQTIIMCVTLRCQS